MRTLPSPNSHNGCQALYLGCDSADNSERQVLAHEHKREAKFDIARSMTFVKNVWEVAAEASSTQITAKKGTGNSRFVSRIRTVRLSWSFGLRKHLVFKALQQEVDGDCGIRGHPVIELVEDFKSIHKLFTS